MIAVLFAEANGVYCQRESIDLWDISRDARLYAGPYPVVAHPPCSRWCRLAGLVEHRWGYKKGDDGGTFEAALRAVRQYGGVLEHPAYSDAWRVFDLPTPGAAGWQGGICGGWVAQVEQGNYGHPAKKMTWLYTFGALELPSLRWGESADGVKALVSWCATGTSPLDTRRRIGKKAAAATPAEFADLLISIARRARVSG